MAATINISNPISKGFHQGKTYFLVDSPTTAVNGSLDAS